MAVIENTSSRQDAKAQHNAEIRSRKVLEVARSAIFHKQSRSISTIEKDFDHAFEVGKEIGYFGSPRTLAELRMCSVSWEIRQKPDWWQKIHNIEITQKWRQELIAQQSDRPVYKRLTDEMIDYVLAELQDHAQIRNELNGIEIGCFDMIWQSKKLISDDLRNDLLKDVRKLEDQSSNKPDWHPGSNEQVLDLVHPSLYCVVYGRTRATKLNDNGTKSTSILQAPSYEGGTSLDWLGEPEDFYVEKHGTVKLTSPYINNLHPIEHRSMYNTLEKIIAQFIPMWELVLGNQVYDREGLPLNVKYDYALDYDEWDQSRKQSGNFDRIRNPCCIWGDGALDEPDEPGHHPEETSESSGSVLSDEGQPDEEEASEEWLSDHSSQDSMEYMSPTDRAAWLRTLDMVLPEPEPWHPGDLIAKQRPVLLREATIQVIVKLATIHLTPEKPEYAGGSWHIEGMLNEKIVASGIYYYDESNITDSSLAFRSATLEPRYHMQNDVCCMEILYGMTREDPQCQDLGKVVTKQGLGLAWPNIYQHQVSSFRLENPSKAGHRKILAFFLVDPKRKIPSATDVPPQQLEWYERAIAEAGAASGLLPELTSVIASDVDNAMTPKEAEEYRLALMGERMAFVKKNDRVVYHRGFSLCEH